MVCRAGMAGGRRRSNLTGAAPLRRPTRPPRGPPEARLVELADGCRIVPRGLVHLSAIPSGTRLTTNSRDEGGNHQAVGVSLADRDAGSTLMKRSPPWATLTGE